MASRRYRSLPCYFEVNRREFLKVGSAVGAGLVLGTPRLWAQDAAQPEPPAKPRTNVADALAIPRTAHSLPGPFPGRVIEVHDENSLVEGGPDAAVVAAMFERGLRALTGKGPAESHALFFHRQDVIGIKVNPVGAGLISTRHEVVEAIIDWLVHCGTRPENIIIWERFESMLNEAGFTAEHYPRVGLAALQIIDDAAWGQEDADTSGFLDENGVHLSTGNFDDDVYYWADVEGPRDVDYLNQHVENGKKSRFGKLLTRKLTKIINVPVFKNTGNGISMATKNIGYGATTNTGRLHRPLFFDVCTEVLAFPPVRDKLVLNVTDGLIGQYDGGPGANASFTYDYHRLFLATDPFALDKVCHDLILQKRKEMGVDVNEHPRFTEYLRYAERLGLGVADAEKIAHVSA